MTEEMNTELNEMKDVKVGEIVKGKVAKIDENQVYVDFGYKFDGVIPFGELSNVQLENPEEVIQLGQEVELKIVSINDEKEQVILSKKAVDSEKAWESLQQKLDNETVIEAKVAEVVKGGLVVDVGVRGFVPASLVERHFVEDFSDYKGKTLRVVVTELDKEKNRVILSQKAVLDKEFEQSKKDAFKKVQVGSVVEGTVQRLTNFGAFVDIGGVDGLVHVSELSWDRVDKPTDFLKEGQNIKVKVLKVDPENQKISLSIKETMESPWNKAMSQIKNGEIYSGTVKRLVTFGAFVELIPNVEGLVHISQISQDHITNPNEVLQVGQQVKVKVLDINPDNERISLSIKEAQEKDEVQAQYTDNQTGLGLTLGDVLGEKLKKFK